MLERGSKFGKKNNIAKIYIMTNIAPKRWVTSDNVI